MPTPRSMKSTPRRTSQRSTSRLRPNLDGMSLDDKRSDLLPKEKIGPKAILTDEEYAKNNLPDIAARWKTRADAERKRPRTAQSFCVPKEEIVAAGYDLSINRYKEMVPETG